LSQVQQNEGNMNTSSACIAREFSWSDEAGHWIGMLGIRQMLTYEFAVSDPEKLHGQNWLANIMGDFPFPFSLVPADVSGFIPTWTELIGAAALVVGLLIPIMLVPLVCRAHAGSRSITGCAGVSLKR
jgi:hypothetical protein